MSPTPLPYGLSGRDEQHAYFDWLVGLFDGALGGQVLDHGAGTGMLSQRLAPKAERVWALEPDATLHALLAERFAATPNVTALHGTIETYLRQRGARSLDAIVSSNVLEHLQDDLGCLRQLREALRPGGALAVYVPARRELFGSLDRAVGHLRRYTRPLLAQRLEAAGFFVEWLRYGNLVGVLPWWVSGRLLEQSAASPAKLRWFDRWVFPAATRVEALLGIPYGLNLAALARRL